MYHELMTHPLLFYSGIIPTQLSKVVLKKYHSKRGLHPLPY